MERGRGTPARVDGFSQIVEPFVLEGDPPPGDESNGCKPQCEGSLRLIAKGDIQEDSIPPVIVVPGEEDFLHLGEGNF